MNFVDDGIPLGRMAGFEFMLTYKLDSLAIPEDKWSNYCRFFTNVFLTKRAAERVLAHARPDRVVTYNTLYGVNRVWKELAEKRGIPVYSIHAGLDPARRLETLMMYRDDNELKRVRLPCRGVRRRLGVRGRRSAFRGSGVVPG
jgi:hypothetical protein